MARECRTCAYWSKGHCTFTHNFENGTGRFCYQESDDYYTDGSGNKHWYGNGREDYSHISRYEPLPWWIK